MDIKCIPIIRYKSPAGEMILGSIGESLCIADWLASKNLDINLNRISRNLDAVYVERSSLVIEAAIKQLDEYFAGQRTSFSIPLIFSGSEFQNRVWEELMNVPYGATISYGKLAERIGRPSAVRAVAGAVGANPMSIFVPCHRIIGANNTLTGYAAGVHVKWQLLALESSTGQLL